jgi:spermidine synthase
MRSSASSRDNLLLGFFSAALFLAALLMFSVQPMAGKMLLPLVGGAPSGWIVAMAFFQVMLLAGYFYAHALSRLSPLLHGALYAAALLAGCLLLPARLPEAAPGHEPGPGGVFLLLTAALGAPFVALSATSSTLQRLFAASGHRAGRDPYFLYAASNLGSFAGLLLYPLFFERLWGLHDQSQYWQLGYAVLVAAALCALLPVRGKNKRAAAPKVADTSPRTTERLRWIALAFIPSALLCAVTTHIATDIFSAPMLWVLPLALYLLTFVAAFARKPPVSPERAADIQPIVIAVALGFLMMVNGALRMSWLGVVVQLAAFTCVALLCHLRLATLRPVKDGRRLTEFYLMLSVGGALGGVLNAFILPVVLDRLIEYPVLLLLSCLANPSWSRPAPAAAKKAFAIAMAAAGTYTLYLHGAAAYVRALKPGAITAEALAADGLLLLALLLSALNVRTLALGGLVMVLLVQFVIPRDSVLHRRDFYGVVTVLDYPMEIPAKATAPAKIVSARYLMHGTTTHGLQIRDPALSKTTTAYFWRGGPAGQAFAAFQPRDIAVIGLGAGTLNCYATAHDAFTFIEIDPAVAETAQDPALFTFLSACKGRQPPRVIVGDGRLKLAKLEGKYDLVVLDAFSSDTVPAHLLTLEALRLYLDHLKKDGVLLLNLSSRYFNLCDVAARAAAELHLAARMRLDRPPPGAPYASASRWVALARTETRLAPLDAKGWARPGTSLRQRPWTDDYAYTLSALDFSALPAQ